MTAGYRDADVSMLVYSAATEDFRSLLRIPLTWRVIGGWTLGYGTLSWLVEWLTSYFDHTAGPFPWLFGMNRMVYAIVWAGAILAAIALTEWQPVSRFSQAGRIALHSVACLTMTVVWGVVAYYACLAIVPGWQPQGVGHMLASTSKNVLFGYLLVTVLVHIVWRVRHYRAQEVTMLRQAKLATEAQLQVLKMELQPHFLFNALHSISALIHTDPDAANETLVRLSDMLRHAVRTARVQEVQLRDEIVTTQFYTQIERVRFGDRLRLSWNIDPETLGAAVPHMLLQPLLENAIKHGLEVRSDAGRVSVTTRREGEMLALIVRDDGPGPGAAELAISSGLGLTNTRTRLRELYGVRHTFTLSNVKPPDRGALVEIKIPFAPMTADTTQDASATLRIKLSADMQDGTVRAPFLA